MCILPYCNMHVPAGSSCYHLSACLYDLLSFRIAPGRTVYVVDYQGEERVCQLFPSLDESYNFIFNILELDDLAKTKFDPEEDILIIWEVLPSGHMKPVFTCAGLKWTDAMYGSQSALPGRLVPLIQEILVAKGYPAEVID